MAEKRNWGQATRAIHGGMPNVYGGVAPPVDFSTTFEIPLDVPFEGAISHPLLYQRWGHPGAYDIEKRLAFFADVKHCISFPSGMPAIHGVIWALVGQGDHIIAADDLYGGTHELLINEFPRFGVRTSFIDVTNAPNIQKVLQNNTKLLWMEIISNPLLKIPDLRMIRAVCDEAKRSIGCRDLKIIIDTTFSPMSARDVLTLGADAVLDATTKYTQGHGSSLGGVVLTSDDELGNIIRAKRPTAHCPLLPDQCFRTAEGLKTMVSRVEVLENNASQVAMLLEDHRAVQWVLYPGLPSHPQHELAQRQLKHFGSVITFKLRGGRDHLKKFREKLQGDEDSPFTFGVSLGGVESLFEFPYFMTHGLMSEEEKDKLGFDETLVRLAIGIEDIEDITDALKKALNYSTTSD